MKFLHAALVALLASMASMSPAASIIWVTDTASSTSDNDTYGAYLRSLGHTVTVRDDLRTLDSTKIAALNAADLVIVSRNTDSGVYATDATEIGQWNSITAPLILGSAYLARGATDSRWGWTNNTGLVSNTSVDMFVTAGQTNHPLFAGIALASPDSSFDPTSDTGENLDLVTGGAIHGSGTILTTGGGNVGIAY